MAPPHLAPLGSWTSVTMIHFCLAHSAYRLHCWLPRSPAQAVTVFSFGITTLALQFYVLLRPRSSLYCSQPLLTNLVADIIYTFCTIGFTVLLIQMEPVPRALKRLFSAFGVGSFTEGVCTMGLTVLATDCQKTTPERYYLSVLLSVGSLVSTVLFSGLGLIWLASVTCPGARCQINGLKLHVGPADLLLKRHKTLRFQVSVTTTLPPDSKHTLTSH